MKKLLILVLGAMFALACTETKKEDKNTEDAIQKIDSIQVNIEKDIENLERFTKELQEDLKDLDNI